jgi:hypothetical protein
MLMARPVVAAPPRRRIRKDSSISETTELGAEPQLADQVCTARSDSSTMRVEFSVPRFGSLNGKRRSSVGGRPGKLQTHRSGAVRRGGAAEAARAAGSPRARGLLAEDEKCALLRALLAQVLGLESTGSAQNSHVGPAG